MMSDASPKILSLDSIDKPKILRLDHIDTPYILLFESVSSEQPENSVVIRKGTTKGQFLYLLKSDINKTRNGNIGVKVYAGWTSLIAKKAITGAGMYYISADDNSGVGYYAIIQKQRGKLLIVETGTNVDILKSENLSMSQFTLISINSLSGETSKLKELVLTQESNVTVPAVLSMLVIISAVLFFIQKNNGDFLKFNIGPPSESSNIYNQYMEAKRLYIQSWPNDLVAVSEFINVLKKGANPSTYDNYVDWGKQVAFSIMLDSKTASNYSNTTVGVMGDYVMTISNPGFTENDDISINENIDNWFDVDRLNEETINLLRNKTIALKNSVKLAPVSRNWSIVYDALKGISLDVKYSHNGMSNYSFTPNELLENDKSGYRQAIVTGDPVKVLTAVAYVQTKAPVSIQSFKITKSDYSDQMSMIIKVRGS